MTGAAPPRAFRVIENTWIPLNDGCRLAARIWLPEGAETRPVPAILEYLPYRKRDGTSVRDEVNHAYFASRGYACVRVDIRGNGESDGLMTDEYTPEELADGVAAIVWIAAQAWCTGRVGMIGISWGGFNGLQVAALRPPGLGAVVTLCSTDDRYADDVHYMGGCLLNDNMTWSQQMLGYSSRPPDPALVGERWRDMWLERLRAMPLLAASWLRHPHRDDYWRHGSVCEDYSDIEVPVLAVGGWSDAYPNAVFRLLSGLSPRARGIVGPWEHSYPNLADVGPRIDFLAEAARWWDRWLRDAGDGAEDEPALRVFVMDSEPPSSRFGDRRGRWVCEPEWPPQRTASRRLHPGADGLGEAPAPGVILAVPNRLDIGLDAGSFCPGMRIDGELPGDQRDDDARSLVLDAEPLDAPLEILGAPVLDVTLSSDRPRALLVARLCDVAPDGASRRITWAPLNLTHRRSHAAPEPLVPGETVRVRLVLNHAGYRIAAGHRLRLALSSAYWPMIWPSPEPAKLQIHAGETTLDLPIRTGAGDEAGPAFAPPPDTPAPRREVLRAPAWSRHVETGPDGTVTLSTEDDFGAMRDPAHGLETGSRVCQRFSIRPHDPLSATAWAGWTHTLSRGTWRVRTETWTRMTADGAYFRLEARLEAWEGDERIFERDWDESIPRDEV